MAAGATALKEEPAWRDDDGSLGIIAKRSSSGAAFNYFGKAITATAQAM